MQKLVRGIPVSRLADTLDHLVSMQQDMPTLLLPLKTDTLEHSPFRGLWSLVSLWHIGLFVSFPSLLQADLFSPYLLDMGVVVDGLLESIPSTVVVSLPQLQLLHRLQRKNVTQKSGKETVLQSAKSPFEKSFTSSVRPRPSGQGIHTQKTSRGVTY